ncbi:MAG: hypothetical protein ACYDBQ_08325 [Thermoplasmatota archaeon]
MEFRSFAGGAWFGALVFNAPIVLFVAIPLALVAPPLGMAALFAVQALFLVGSWGLWLAGLVLGPLSWQVEKGPKAHRLAFWLVSLVAPPAAYLLTPGSIGACLAWAFGLWSTRAYLAARGPASRRWVPWTDGFGGTGWGLFVAPLEFSGTRSPPWEVALATAVVLLAGTTYLMAAALRRPGAWDRLPLASLMVLLPFWYDGPTWLNVGEVAAIGAFTAAAVVLVSPRGVSFARRAALATAVGLATAVFLGWNTGWGAASGWIVAAEFAVGGVAIFVLCSRRPANLAAWGALGGAAVAVAAGYVESGTVWAIALPGFLVPWMGLVLPLRPVTRLGLVPLQYAGMVPFFGDVFGGEFATNLALVLGLVHFCLVWLLLPAAGPWRRVLSVTGLVVGALFAVAAAGAEIQSPTAGRLLLVGATVAFLAFVAALQFPGARRWEWSMGGAPS